MLLGLVGVSGVGKTYFKEKIVQELGFQAVNTIRTREKRIGEENGKTGLFKRTWSQPDSVYAGL